MSRSKPIRIGVIADTHGLFDPALRRYFHGVDRIIHAGDIGRSAVIEQLEEIAPVTAVSGNVDQYETSGFPRRTVIRRRGRKIAVCHIVYEKGALTGEARQWLRRECPDVCIFGHSHRPTIESFGRTVLFNPGSAGPKRFSLPRSIGMLTVGKGRVAVIHIRLADKAERTKTTRDI